jgi:hypothetical protein
MDAAKLGQRNGWKMSSVIFIHAWRLRRDACSRCQDRGTHGDAADNYKTREA